MKRELLSVLAAALLVAVISISALALSNHLKDGGTLPGIKGSSDQTIIPATPSPLAYPMGRVPDYLKTPHSIPYRGERRK